MGAVAIGGAAGGAASAGGGSFLGTLFGAGGGFSSFLAGPGPGMLLNIGLSLLARRKRKKEEERRIREGIEITGSPSIDFAPIVLGRRQVEQGVVVLKGNVVVNAGGRGWFQYTEVQAWAAAGRGGIGGIKEIWLDEDRYVVDAGNGIGGTGSDFVLYNPSTVPNAPTAPRNQWRYAIVEFPTYGESGKSEWANNRKWGYRSGAGAAANEAPGFELTVYDGSQTAADPGLVAKGSELHDWDRDFIGRNFAYTVMVFTRHGQNLSLWDKRGFPKIRVVLEGDKVPLTKAVQNTPASWTFSRNPAYLATYAHFELPVGTSIDANTPIDWTRVAAAATTADQTLTIPAGTIKGVAQSNTTEKRYNADVVVQGSATPAEIISQLELACDGDYLKVDGSWALDIPTSEADSGIELVDEMLASRATLIAGENLSSRFTSIAAAYIAPNENWKRVFTPEYESSTLLSKEGRALPRQDIALDAVTSFTQAWRLLLRQALREEQQEQISIEGFHDLLRIRRGVNFKYKSDNLGISSFKRFVAENVSTESGSSPVVIVAREELTVRVPGESDPQPKVYQDPALTDYPTYTNDGTLVVPATPPFPVQSLVATGKFESIELQIGLPDIYGDIEIYESETSSWNHSSRKLAWRGKSSVVVLPYEAGTTRWFWARNNIGGELSTRFPNDDVTTVTATALGAAVPIYGPLPAGKNCPPSDEGSEEQLWFVPDGQVFQYFDPWEADDDLTNGTAPDTNGVNGGVVLLKKGVVFPYVGGAIREFRVAVNFPLPSGFFEETTSGNARLSVMQYDPSNDAISFEFGRNVANAYRPTGDSHFIFAFRFSDGSVFTIGGSEFTLTGGFASSPQTFRGTKTVEFLDNKTADQTVDLLILLSNKRCEGDPLNPWSPVQSLVTQTAGQSLEFVFTLDDNRSLPSGSVPPNNLPYHQAFNSSGRDVGFYISSGAVQTTATGQRWFGTEPVPAAATPWQGHMYRTVTGLPERGDPKEAGWGNWQGPFWTLSPDRLGTVEEKAWVLTAAKSPAPTALSASLRYKSNPSPPATPVVNIVYDDDDGLVDALSSSLRFLWLNRRFVTTADIANRAVATHIPNAAWDGWRVIDRYISEEPGVVSAYVILTAEPGSEIPDDTATGTTIPDQTFNGSSWVDSTSTSFQNGRWITAAPDYHGLAPGEIYYSEGTDNGTNVGWGPVSRLAGKVEPPMTGSRARWTSRNTALTSRGRFNFRMSSGFGVTLNLNPEPARLDGESDPGSVLSSLRNLKQGDYLWVLPIGSGGAELRYRLLAQVLTRKPSVTFVSDVTTVGLLLQVIRWESARKSWQFPASTAYAAATSGAFAGIEIVFPWRIGSDEEEEAPEEPAAATELDVELSLEGNPTEVQENDRAYRLTVTSSVPTGVANTAVNFTLRAKLGTIGTSSTTRAAAKTTSGLLSNLPTALYYWPPMAVSKDLTDTISALLTSTGKTDARDFLDVKVMDLASPVRAERIVAFQGNGQDPVLIVRTILSTQPHARVIETTGLRIVLRRRNRRGPEILKVRVGLSSMTRPVGDLSNIYDYNITDGLEFGAVYWLEVRPDSAVGYGPPQSLTITMASGAPYGYTLKVFPSRIVSGASASIQVASIPGQGAIASNTSMSTSLGSLSATNSLTGVSLSVPANITETRTGWVHLLQNERGGPAGVGPAVYRAPFTVVPARLSVETDEEIPAVLPVTSSPRKLTATALEATDDDCCVPVSGPTEFDWVAEGNVVLSTSTTVAGTSKRLRGACAIVHPLNTQTVRNVEGSVTVQARRGNERSGKGLELQYQQAGSAGRFCGKRFHAVGDCGRFGQGHNRQRNASLRQRQLRLQNPQCPSRKLVPVLGGDSSLGKTQGTYSGIQNKTGQKRKRNCLVAAADKREFQRGERTRPGRVFRQERNRAEHCYQDGYGNRKNIQAAHEMAKRNNRGRHHRLQCAACGARRGSCSVHGNRRCCGNSRRTVRGRIRMHDNDVQREYKLVAQHRYMVGHRKDRSGGQGRQQQEDSVRVQVQRVAHFSVPVCERQHWLGKTQQRRFCVSAYAAARDQGFDSSR